MRDRELRSPVEARRTLTRLMVITCIAVSLETVFYLSTAEKDQIQNLIYPAILLLNAVAVRVGLGAYQKQVAPLKPGIPDEFQGNPTANAMHYLDQRPPKHREKTIHDTLILVFLFLAAIQKVPHLYFKDES